MGRFYSQQHKFWLMSSDPDYERFTKIICIMINMAFSEYNTPRIFIGFSRFILIGSHRTSMVLTSFIPK